MLKCMVAVHCDFVCAVYQLLRNTNVFLILCKYTLCQVALSHSNGSGPIKQGNNHHDKYLLQIRVLILTQTFSFGSKKPKIVVIPRISYPFAVSIA